MPTEIERKFRVTRMADLNLGEGKEIVQAYLATGEFNIRIRISRGKAILTIKFAHPDRERFSGAIVQNEFEYEIPIEDAHEMMEATDLRIEKTRHDLPGGIELDVFKGKHAGLVLAEYESQDGSAPPPPEGIEWVEVSDDPRFANSWMAQHGLPPV